MSKADELLKKATFFEKLALYSDRQAFLQAIAQREDPSAQLSSAISEFNRIVRQNSARLDPKIPGMLIDVVEGGQYPQALKLMEQIFRYPLPNDVRSQLDQKFRAAQAALQKVSELASLPTGPAQVTEETEPVGTGTGTRVKETPGAPGGSPAVAALQTQLNYILFGDPANRVMPIPLKVDGVVGDRTKEALDLFKSQNPQAANLTGSALLNEVKRIYDTTKMYEASR